MSSEPTLNNNKNQEFSSPNLDVVDNDKQKAVSAPQTINPSDPFDFFHGDIAYRIISELDAADTELLRRVSKLWKATSEFCCRRTLLSQHFPEAAASLSENEMGSDEEENLRFRRHLYRRQSFQLGYATRILCFEGTNSWGLKNDTLIRADLDGEVRIRNLRAKGVGVPCPPQVPDKNEESRTLPRQFYNVEQVSLLKGGDLIVQSWLGDNMIVKRDAREERGQFNERSTARVNQAGQVLWEIITSNLTRSRPAIGEKEVFFITESDFNTGREKNDPILIKYSLQDGSIVPDSELVGPEQDGHPTNQSFDALFLTNNEKFAVWNDGHGLISIISLNNRKRAYGFRIHDTAVISKSFISEGLWVIHGCLQDAAPDVDLDSSSSMGVTSYFIPWKENTTGFHVQPIIFPSMLQSQDGEEWLFDADSAVFLHKALAARPTPPTVTLGALSRLTLATTHQIPSTVPGHIQFMMKSTPVEISLPKSTGQPGQRKPVDIILPKPYWSSDRRSPLNVERPRYSHLRLDEGTWQGGSLRVINNYVLLYFPFQKLLYIIDFWPSW